VFTGFAVAAAVVVVCVGATPVEFAMPCVKADSSSSAACSNKKFAANSSFLSQAK